MKFEMIREIKKMNRLLFIILGLLLVLASCDNRQSNVVKIKLPQELTVGTRVMVIQKKYYSENSQYCGDIEKIYKLLDEYEKIDREKVKLKIVSIAKSDFEIIVSCIDKDKTSKVKVTKTGAERMK